MATSFQQSGISPDWKKNKEHAIKENESEYDIDDLWKRIDTIVEELVTISELLHRKEV